MEVGGACSLVSGRVRQSKDSWQHTSLPTPAFLHQLGSHNQNIQMQAGEKEQETAKPTEKQPLCHFDPNGIFMIVLSMFMTSVRRKSRMPSKMTPLGEDVDISTDRVATTLSSCSPGPCIFSSVFTAKCLRG